MTTSIAIVMPAYNEEGGITEFITELLTHLEGSASRLTVVVADDRSTDATATRVRSLDDPRVRVETQPLNRGHGPTALAAYRAGLDLDPDVLIHVDGDGQFLGADVRRCLDLLLGGDLDVVHGVRMQRSDPWFRKLLTRSLRAGVSSVVGRRIDDINTPLRVYRAEVAARLLAATPRDALVPHVHFSIAEARWALRVGSANVLSIPRRGGNENGTMWGGHSKRPKLPPRKLLSFSRRAAAEVWRHSLAPGAPSRREN